MSEPAKSPKMVPVFTSSGELAEVPEDKYESALKFGGIRPATKAEVDEHFAREEAKGEPVKAAVEGLLRGPTLGLSDYGLQALGADKEKMRLRREELPVISRGAEVVGDVATALIPGGSFVKAGKLAGEGKIAGAAVEGAKTALNVGKVPIKAGEAVANALARAGAGSTRGIAKAITGKFAQRVAGEAVEGALYGARQAVTEDALGNTDLTAESLLHNAGLGALIGGATGGTLNVLGAGMKALGKTGTSATKKFLKLGADEGVEQAANKEAYAVLRPTKKDIQLSTEASRQEHGRWLHENKLIGKNKTLDDVAKGAEQIADTTAPKIEQVYKELDQIHGPAKADTAANLYKRVDDEVIAPLRNDPFLREYAAKVEAKLQGFKDDFLPDVAGAVKKSLGYEDLWKVRKSLDTTINFDKDPANIGLNNYLRNVRDIFQETLETPPSTTPRSAELIKNLKVLNKDYSLAMRTKKMAENVLDGQAASQSKLGMFDRLSGITGATVGTSVLGPIGGLAAGAAFAYGNKMLKERGAMVAASVLDDIAKLGQLEKTQNSTLSQIRESIKGLLDGARKAATPTAVDTTFGFLGAGKVERKKGESRQEAAIRRINEVRDLVSDPDHFGTMMVERTRHLQGVAPNTALALQQATMRAASFLNERLPKDPTFGTTPTPLAPSQWQPTGADIAKAMRLIRAVENPKLVLEDIKNGNVSLDSMDALKAVYPSIHAQLVKSIFEQAADRKKPLSYNQKVQLSIITGVPVDPTLQPKMIKKLQSNFTVNEKQRRSGGQSGSPGVKSLASSTMTQGQRLGTR